MQAPFASYDEDGNESWTPDGELCLLCYCSDTETFFVAPQRFVSDERVFRAPVIQS